METPKTSSDEIDLMELFLKLIRVAKKNFTLIVSFFVVGTLLGSVYGMFGTKVYESKMMVTSDILTESYSEKLAENLKALINDGNLALLSSRLNLTTEDAKSVGSIKIESALKDKPSKEDEKKWFIVTVQILNQEILPSLEKGIVNYIENNEYVKIRVEQKRNLNKELIKKTDEEIQSLESFKKKIYEGNFFENNKGNVMFDPTVVNIRIIELNKDKLKYQNDLQIVNSVQIVEGFTKFLKPIKPNKAISLAAGSTLGLFFVAILIAFKSIRKVVRMAEEAEKN
jgi:uncharacterized protein involved in exopolysaccharide biosynthesis